MGEIEGRDRYIDGRDREISREIEGRDKEIKGGDIETELTITIPSKAG